MSENAGSMQALRQQVAGCPSGDRLAAALETASLANSDIPALICSVIGEKLAVTAPSTGGAESGAAATKGGAAVVATSPAAAVPATVAAAAPAERVSLADALCVIDGLMFLSPRGKQQLALFGDHLVVKTSKADLSVPWAAIKHVAIMDCIPGDTKGKVLLYLHIDSEQHKVMNGKTPLAAVVIQTTSDAQLDVAHPQGGGRLQGAAPVVLCQALGAVPGGVDPTCFISPDPAFFQSADKAAGIGAHVKAKSGFLYPLPSALVFLESPPLFLPHSAIRSVELMRAGGASATFDVVLHLRSGRQQEFGFIARQEAGALEDYIRKCPLAVGAAESSEEEAQEGGSAEGRTEAGAEVGSSDDDSEDEDFNPSSSSDEEEEEQEQGGEGPQQQRSGGGAKRKRGAALAEGGTAAAEGSGTPAAVAAEEGGSDDEDDASEDEEEEESSEEESSDDDGSVELVSEDDFSMGQLESVMAGEGSGGGSPPQPRAKRQRS